MRNCVQLIGNLGADPEVRTTEKGEKFATFSLATTDYYLNGEGEKQEDTQWHKVVAWGRKAETAIRFLCKGKQVVVHGKIVYRNYVGTDGQTKRFTQIHLVNFTMVGKLQRELESA